jgi:hypothetical protein
MSRKYKESSDVPTDVICDRLDELADAVTKGDRGMHEFTMRIPAEPDRDADLVLSAAATRLRLANEALKQAGIRIKELSS